MVLKMPVFLVFFGEEAAALQGDVALSLHEYLEGADLRNVTLWRVDAAEACAAAVGDVACHDLCWQAMQADGYIETVFSHDYQRMVDSLIDTVGTQTNCYVGVVVSGAQADAQALGTLQRRLGDVLSRLNRRLRPHLIWLIEDHVMRLGSNYRMLRDDLENGKPALEQYQRISVLSGSQMNGANSYATRRQRLDALVPCVLEAANAATLDGAKVQTVAFRKLNCTSTEIRRLMGQRVIDAVATWQTGPLDTLALWGLFSTPDMPFAGYADRDAGTMAQCLMRCVQATLPTAEDMIVTPEPDCLSDPFALVEDFQRNNEAALLDRFSGDAWEAQWLAGVEAALRRCLYIRTARGFIVQQGAMRQRLASMAEAMGTLVRGFDFRRVAMVQGGLFGRGRASYDTLATAANEYLSGLASRILQVRLKRILKALDQVEGTIDTLLGAVEGAMKPHRLPVELEELYHALAESYDEAICAALGRLHLTDEAILGETQVFYPADGAELASLWQSVHQRLMARITDAENIFREGFSEAYALGKQTPRLEADIRDKLSVCSWQLSGGNVVETDVAFYYANQSICKQFPSMRLGGMPLERIPGDLVAYAQFGAVAATLADMLTFLPFRPGDALDVNLDALNALLDRPRNPAQPAPPPPQGMPPAEDDPWHLRLDERNGVFTLYWVWPNGYLNNAIIQITHQSGEKTTVPCTRELYNRSMGRVIPPEKLGIGTNTITVVHDQQSQTIRVMGRRVNVRYQALATRHHKTVALGETRITLYQHEVRYHIDDPLMGEGLRLLRYCGATPVVNTLPGHAPLAGDGYVTRFYTTSATVALCSAAEYEGILDIQCD